MGGRDEKSGDRQKILIVHNHYQIPGGEDTVVENERKLLESYGHKVILYSRDNTELQKFPLFRKLLLPFGMVFSLKTYREIKKIICEQRVDLVHVHNTLVLISPSAYYAAFHCKIPVVQTMHNFRMLCPGATFYRDGHICEECVKWGLKCAVRYNCYRDSKVQTLGCVISTMIHRFIGTYKRLNYICLTEFNKEKLLMLNRPGKRKIVEESKVFIKPNFTFANERNKRTHKEFYVFLGRIEESKGIKILIDAFSQMSEKKLLIAGGGKDFVKYQKYLEKKGAQNIEFIGFVSGSERERIMAGAKALIVASQLYETFGMVIIEAFADAVPVIVGDIGNVGSLVEKGKTGWKFQYDSAEALKNAVNEFEKFDIDVLGDNAFQRYKQKYSPENNYQQLTKIYQSVSGE